MRHETNSNTFNEAYVNERVRFHVQNAFLERPSEDGLLKAFAHMGLTCDPRASRDYIGALPPDPKIAALEKERATLKTQIDDQYGKVRFARGTAIGQKYESAKISLVAAQKKRRKLTKAEHRWDYFQRRHTEDIEQQLNGFRSEEYVKPVVQHQLSERVKLQKILCEFPRDLNEQEMCQRRIDAVYRMVVLCHRREVLHRKGRQVSNSAPALEVNQSIDSDLFPLICKKKQCIFCIRDEALTYHRRTFSYCRSSKMMDHVETHLKGIAKEERVPCMHPICKANGVAATNVMAFKNHTAIVHKISLRV